jgi:hypothetical protein
VRKCECNRAEADARLIGCLKSGALAGPAFGQPTRNRPQSMRNSVHIKVARKAIEKMPNLKGDFDDRFFKMD